jgi:prevent-host-death family protein
MSTRTPAMSKGGNVLRMTSTDARRRFRQLLELVAGGATVIITRRGVPRAVALPPDEHGTHSATPIPSLDELTAEFDAMLERMQAPK